MNSHSFLRWAGGKKWLVPKVKKIIDGLEFNNYIEPFLGGASIFFSLELDKQAYLSDINEDLINTYIQIRDNLETVSNYLERYENGEDAYYAIRSLEPNTLDEKAAKFIYLNATSFNGIYRVNRQGKYNVPYGNRNYTHDIDKLKWASNKLQKASISTNDFSVSKKYIKKGDLVFLDPPYVVAEGKNGFLQYNPKLFSIDDQKRLGELIDYINNKGAYYIMTNAAHNTIAEIFENKGRLIIENRNSVIGGRNARRGLIKEYIFTNIPEKEEKDGTN